MRGENGGGGARGTHHIRELELDHRREFRLRRERGGVEGWQGQFDRDGGTGRKIEPPSLPRARREPRAPRGRRIRDARARQRETIERTHVFDAGRHGRCRRPCGTRGWRACAALESARTEGRDSPREPDLTRHDLMMNFLLNPHYHKKSRNVQFSSSVSRAGPLRQRSSRKRGSSALTRLSHQSASVVPGRQSS